MTGDAPICRLNEPGAPPSEWCMLLMRPLALWVLLLSLLVGAGPAESADQLRMTVRPGLDGVVKLGVWFPVEVTVANAGADVSGEVQVTVDGIDNRGAFNRPAMIYAAPAVLPKQSNKRFVVEVFLPNPVERLTAKLVSEGS